MKKVTLFLLGLLLVSQTVQAVEIPDCWGAGGKVPGTYRIILSDAHVNSVVHVLRATHGKAAYKALRAVEFPENHGRTFSFVVEAYDWDAKEKGALEPAELRKRVEKQLQYVASGLLRTPKDKATIDIQCVDEKTQLRRLQYESPEDIGKDDGGGAIGINKTAKIPTCENGVYRIWKDSRSANPGIGETIKILTSDFSLRVMSYPIQDEASNYLRFEVQLVNGKDDAENARIKLDALKTFKKMNPTDTKGFPIRLTYITCVTDESMPVKRD